MLTRETLEQLANALEEKSMKWEPYQFSQEMRNITSAKREVYANIAEMIRSVLPPKDGVYR